MSEQIEDAEYAEGTTALAVVDPDQFASGGSGAIAVPGDKNARPKTPWVGFKSSKTKEPTLSALNAAKIDVNTFYLNDGEPLKVTPFEFHPVRFFRCYTKLNPKGTQKVGAALTYDEQRHKDNYREAITALIFVRLRNEATNKTILVPACIEVRGALTKALEKAIQFFDGAAATAESWGVRSQNHLIASNARWPGGRFIATAWGTEEDTKDGENSFNLGHSDVRPTDANGVALFNELTTGEGFKTKFLPAYANFQWRVEQIQKLLPKA